MTKTHHSKYPLPVLSNKDLTPEEYIKLRYGPGWQSYLSEEQAREAHKINLEACKAAVKQNIEDRKNDGPIKILLVNGSSRSAISCAAELSNSQLLARIGIQGLDERDDVEIDEVNLRDYNISPCNGCYSTTSALCGFPCNCFPFDPMQKLYPKVLWCDVLLCSTGVYQSAMASRLKLFCDRLISLDGGYLVLPEQFRHKDANFRRRMIKTSQEQEVKYDPRMWGKVAAFFISSKDENDNPKGRWVSSYVRHVADELRQGFDDFGMLFADTWYASASSVVDEELSYDKQRLLENKKAHTEAKEVVLEAIELAKKLRKDPPKPTIHPKNRT